MQEMAAARVVSCRGWPQVLLLVGALLASGPAAAEVAVPPLKARVTDLTATLSSAQQATLEQTLATFEARKGSQIAVLLVPTTQPETVDQYAVRVEETWKLGRKGIDDGVLLVIARNDRKLRIEVGYGLEGVLNDATAKRIIEEEITPRFKQGDFYGGISAGVGRIIKVVDGEPLPPPKSRKPAGGGLDFESLLFIGFILVFVVGGILRAIFGRFLGAARLRNRRFHRLTIGGALLIDRRRDHCSFFRCSPHAQAAGLPVEQRWTVGRVGGGGGFSGGGGGLAAAPGGELVTWISSYSQTSVFAVLVRCAFPRRTLAAIENVIRVRAVEGELRARGRGGPRSAASARADLASASEVFSALRVWDTGHNSGVLIYVQLVDHRIEIVADRGISARVEQQQWDAICRRMEEAFRQRRFEPGVLTAIGEITSLLALHFPPVGDNPDELSDQPMIL